MIRDEIALIQDMAESYRRVWPEFPEVVAKAVAELSVTHFRNYLCGIRPILTNPETYLAKGEAL